VKIASYNLNGIRARLPRLVEWLDREKPEIVCLQELKCADESLPIADIEAAG
jgi:exodeoxyribonuclease-3